MSFNSKNFDLTVSKNQLLAVSMVNFSSTGNNSDSEVDFSRAKTVVAASFN